MGSKVCPLFGLLPALGMCPPAELVAGTEHTGIVGIGYEQEPFSWERGARTVPVVPLGVLPTGPVRRGPLLTIRWVGRRMFSAAASVSSFVAPFSATQRKAAPEVQAAALVLGCLIKGVVPEALEGLGQARASSPVPQLHLRTARSPAIASQAGAAGLVEVGVRPDWVGQAVRPAVEH